VAAAAAAFAAQGGIVLRPSQAQVARAATLIQTRRVALPGHLSAAMLAQGRMAAVAVAAEGLIIVLAHLAQAAMVVRAQTTRSRQVARLAQVAAVVAPAVTQRQRLAVPAA
jgi:hypothetical protein